jgi:hypothetical protein
VSRGAPHLLTPLAPDRSISPEYRASPLSRLLFLWPASLFRAANATSGGTLPLSALYKLDGRDGVSELTARFEAALDAAVAAGEAQPVRAAIIAMFYWPMALAGAIKFVNSTLNFAPGLLLYGLLNAIGAEAVVRFFSPRQDSSGGARARMRALPRSPARASRLPLSLCAPRRAPAPCGRATTTRWRSLSQLSRAC